MARTRNPEQRIAELLEAGTAVFRRKGFRRTQMSDIADQMNCSTGTLYNYIDSKEALFEHAVVSGFTRSLPQSETLPLGFPKPAAVAVIKRRSQEIAAGSALDQANRREDAEDPIEEVTLIVTTFFLFFSDYHPVLDMIERLISIIRTLPPLILRRAGILFSIRGCAGSRGDRRKVSSGGTSTRSGPRAIS